MDMEHNTSSLLLSDPTIWVVFSFVIFAALAFVFGRKSVTGMLDTQIDKIRNDISSAEKLRAEAEALLTQHQTNLKNASVEADKIIARAKQQAADIRAQSEKEFNETMSRREVMLKTRIEQMERSAIDDIRRYAAEMAITATTEIISQKMTKQSANNLVDNSIDQIATKLN